MKHLYNILFLIFISASFGQKKEIKNINGHQFEIVYKVDNKYTQRDFIELYRGKKKILIHTIFEINGDCSSETIELGTYKIKGNKLIFYTYWAGADRLPLGAFPYGFRKQIYNVTKNGKVNILKSIIYIEGHNQAQELLRKKNLSEEEKHQLNKYIKICEREYLGQFVREQEKQKLEQEVRTILKEEIEFKTGNWTKEVYKFYNK